LVERLNDGKKEETAMEENVVMDIDLPLPKIHSGKVREIFDPSELSETYEDYRLFVATDRVSAFDVVMESGIPFKGKVLHGISAYWFKMLEAYKICPTHMVASEFSQFPDSLQEALTDYKCVLDGRTMLVHWGDPFPAECIVRRALTGSGYKDYQNNDGVVGGWQLPFGLRDGDLLPAPIFTPSTKESGGKHDRNINFAELIELIGEEFAQTVQAFSLSVFSTLQIEAMRRGLGIVDTKFEFVSLWDGTVCIADEVGTPDSTRYDPKTLDKQFLRNWLKSEQSGFDGKPMELPTNITQMVSASYLKAYRIITGYSLV